jgi:hypothetical protein
MIEDLVGSKDLLRQVWQDKYLKAIMRIMQRSTWNMGVT